MPKVACNYVAHFTELTGKFREKIELEGRSLSDLIQRLDEKYEGFSAELVNPADGRLRTVNAILIERPGEATAPLFDTGARLGDGDILTFY